MSTRALIEQQQQKIQHAEKNLTTSIEALRYFAEAFNQSPLCFEAENNQETNFHYRILQLILQYRLSNHDALQALFQFQRSLWQILGISPSASAEVAYERLAYALGSDDLHVLLTMLNQLVDALLKTIARLENKNIAKKRMTMKQQKTTPVTPSSQRIEDKVVYLKDAISNQELFIQDMVDLVQRFQVIAGAPDLGEVLDYISVLQGPISRFYQALQNGMVLSASLYQQYTKTISFVPELTHILHQVHHILEQTMPHLEPQRFFVPEKVQRLSGQDLEQRAANKRLGKFFFSP